MRHTHLLMLLLTFLCSCAVSRKVPENIEFIILQLNDVYEIAPLEGGKIAGLARVATLKKQLEQENPNVIATLSGDFLSPSFLANLKDEDGKKIAGMQMIETLNAMGLDYATFGNHEFDLSNAELLIERIHASDFQYVTCNAFHQAGKGTPLPFTEMVGGEERPIPTFLVHDFQNKSGQSVRVGITGVVLPFNQADYVTYDPVEASFRQAVKEMRPQTDVIIALTHLNEDEDIELARNTDGVALFLGGHDHHNMSHYEGSTIITKADANARTVYIHRITYSPLSRMVQVNSTLQTIDESIEEAAETKKVVERWQQKAERIMEEQGYDPAKKVAVLKTTLEGTEYKIRSRQTNFGALAAWAFAAAMPGADLYLLNSGAMRVDDDLTGTLTEYDILRTFPFGGKIVKMTLPGTRVQELLTTGLESNVGKGGYLQTINVKKQKGLWSVNDTAIEPKKSYAVILPEFVAKGLESNLEFLGEYKYDAPAEVTMYGTKSRNDIRDIVISYLRETH